MPTDADKDEIIMDENIKTRYERAEALLQGLWSRSLVCNVTIIPHWIDHSNFFWYERELTSGKEFRLVDAREKTNYIAFDHGSLAKTLGDASGQSVDELDLPITKLEFSLSPLLLTFSAFGKRWIFNEEQQTCQQIEFYAEDWLMSPDGKKAAFVIDNNIWLHDVKTGEQKPLTHDGVSLYGYASAPTAWWGSKITTDSTEALWSPDSKRLFTLQVDTRLVNNFSVIQHVPQDGGLRPIVSERRIAYPGDSHIDEYRFLAIEVETSRQQEINYRRCPVFRNAAGFFTMGNGWWGDDSRHAYFVDLERGDRLARLVEFDTYSGATKILIEEESPGSCFKLHLDSHAPPLLMPVPGSSEVIWYSERSGWAHLYLYDLNTGKLKHPITSGDWLVRDVLHYDADRRELFIQTAGRIEGRNAYYRDICRVQIDTCELVAIKSGDHETIVFDPMSEMAQNLKITRDIVGGSGVSPNSGYVVTTCSRPDSVPVSYLLDRDGNQLLELETADVSGLLDGWQWPEPVNLLAADGKTDIYGVVFRPSDFSPDKSYPVIDVSWNHEEGCHYPAGSFTNNSLAGYYYLSSAALAELGFIVIYILGRGTSSRHREFSKNECPWLPSSHNQADRISATQQLAERFPYMDLNRVGAGGPFMSTTVALSGLLGHPEFYKVGVSDCPMADPLVMPAFFGEAYGEPPVSIDNRENALDTFANNLQGKLLLMNGMLDLNVHATFRIIEALRAANKDFDLLLLPNDGHTMCSYSNRRAWDYFVTHLLGIDPPKEFDLTNGIDSLMKKVYAARKTISSDVTGC